MPVFGGRSAPLDTPARPGAAGDPRVQLEGAAASLRERIARVPHVTVVDRDGDLVVRPADGGYRIYQAGGVPIDQSPVDAQGVIDRLTAEPDVRQLIGWEFSSPRTGIEMALFDGSERTHRGFFVAGTDRFNLMMRSARPVWPLVVDVDVTGVVTVLYPNSQDGKNVAVAPGSFQDLGEDRADCPCGVEFLKAFVFENKPEGYDSWSGRQFAATDPMMKQLLEVAAGGVAESTLRLITNSKN
jgi:hypothetical protein